MPIRWGIDKRPKIQREREREGQLEKRAGMAKYLNFIVGLLNYCNHLRYICKMCVQITHEALITVSPLEKGKLHTVICTFQVA